MEIQNKGKDAYVKEKISIIVPIFRAERYLPRCIESVLRQTYAQFELVLVLDGNFDRCGDICEEYTKKDKRIRVLHKENGGVSTARNAGLQIATGEYVFFLDSDDWLSKNCLQAHIEAIRKDHSELTFGAYVCKGLKERVMSLGDELVDLYDENVDVAKILGSLTSPWNKLFLTTIIKSNHIAYREDMKVGEDTCFVREYLRFCRKISFFSCVTYFYNQLNALSLTKKHYPGLVEWHKRNFIDLQSLLKLYGAQERMVEDSLKAIAVDNFTFCVKEMLRTSGYNKKESFEGIDVAKQSFLVFTDGVPVKSVFENWETEWIYRSYKRDMRRSRLRNLIKEKTLGLMGPWIEKKRDGLIKWKK